MKKLKSIALCLCVFALSLCMLVGCGKQMAELKNVDFENAETITAEQLSSEIMNENLVPYPYMEISVNANIPMGTSLMTYEINGLLGVNINDNTTITDPSQILNAINGEFNVKTTFDNQEVTGKMYIHEQYMYLDTAEQKLKMSLNSFMGNFLPTSSEVVSPESVTTSDVEQLLSCINQLQKVVDGNYTYYKITFDFSSLQDTTEESQLEVFNQLELVVGINGQQLSKVYVKVGEMMELSINFVKNASISAPSNIDSYIESAE